MIVSETMSRDDRMPLFARDNIRLRTSGLFCGGFLIVKAVAVLEDDLCPMLDEDKSRIVGWENDTFSNGMNSVLV